MIKGNKRWSIYGMLPEDVNMVYIYAPAYSSPIWNRKIEEVQEYLKTRVDTIGKVVRLTTKEAEWFEMYTEDIVIMYNDERVYEPFIENLVAVLREPELDPPIIELIKLLKDGEDLL